MSAFSSEKNVTASMFCITDVTASDQVALLVRKLHQCCALFDFDDSLSEIKSKEVKRACLSELVEYFSRSSLNASDAIYIEVITMVSFIRPYFVTSRMQKYFVFIECSVSKFS